MNSKNPKDTKKSNNPGGRVRSTAIIAEQRRKEKRRLLMIQGGIGLAVVAAVLATTLAVLSSSEDDTTAAQLPNMTAAGGVVVGNANAPVTVSIVEDFGCPFCGRLEAEAGSLLSEYESGDDVKVEYRGIAFLDRAFGTPYSSNALSASACVATNETTDIWKKFHTALFAQQPAEGSDGLDVATLASIAGTSGAGEAAQSCISEGKYVDWAKDQTDATLGKNGVDGTPTIFVNGTEVEQPSAAAIKAAVDKALGS